MGGVSAGIGSLIGSIFGIIFIYLNIIHSRLRRKIASTTQRDICSFAFYGGASLLIILLLMETFIIFSELEPFPLISFIPALMCSVVVGSVIGAIFGCIFVYGDKQIGRHPNQKELKDIEITNNLTKKLGRQPTQEELNRDRWTS